MEHDHQQQRLVKMDISFFLLYAIFPSLFVIIFVPSLYHHHFLEAINPPPPSSNISVIFPSSFGKLSFIDHFIGLSPSLWIILLVCLFL